MNRRMWVWLVALMVLTSGTGWAQIGSEGSIRGLVKDEQGGVLPGVTIVATSPTVAGTVTAVTDAEGAYRLLNLRPGEYLIAAELQGFSKFERSAIVMRAGLNITVDITLKVGALTETVQVTGETPMLETQKAEQAVNISGELQRRLPLGSRRDFTDFLEVTPGVTARSFDQAAGGQVYMLRGTDIENHVTQIDGADMGSFRQNWAGQYTTLSTEALDDVQVKTGGSDASSPLGMGVIMNISTPSGTNQFRGSAGTVYTARGWNGNNTKETSEVTGGGSPAISEILQPDLSIGGPIVKDKVFFFGAYRYTYRNNGIARADKQLADLKNLVSGFEPFDNSARDKFYYVKGTVQITPSHQFYAFYQRDLAPDDANWAYNGQKLDVTAFGGNGTGARLSSVWSNSLTSKVLFSWNDKSINGVEGVWDKYPGTGPSLQVYDSAFISSGRLTGSGFLAQLNNLTSRAIEPAQKMTISADLTWYKTGWGGSHEFQTGLYLQPRLWYSATTTYANNGTAVEDVVLNQAGNSASGYKTFRRRVYDSVSLKTSDRRASDYALYVQDSWKPTSRLTINGGLRFDRVKATDALFDVVVMDAWHVGPRLGATYAITEDRRNVARFSVGRIHDVPNATYLGSAGTNVSGYTDYYDNNLDGTFETVFAQPASSSVSRNRVIDPDRHQAFIDEWLLGYRRQFPGQIAADVSFVRRYYKDRPALVEVNGIYDGNVFKGYKDESQNEIYEITNNEWNWFVYSGLEFTVSKRTSKIQLLGTYTRNWQHIDGTWQPKDPASFIQPSAFPNDTGLGSIRGNVSNSLSGDADIRSPSWQKHSFRVGGSYFAPWDIIVASNFVFLSGPYSGPVVDRIAAADPQFGPATVTLSNGRVVANPLATRIRFAYATRGEGQPKTPNLTLWNIRLGRDFRFGARRFELAFDVFNLLNNGAWQQFLSGGNQKYSPNYAYNSKGQMQGQSRQFARAGQLTVRFVF